MTKVLFSTNCFYRDEKLVVRDFEYRAALCCYPFSELWATVLNVPEPELTKMLLEDYTNRVIVADEVADEVLDFFKLTRESFISPDGDGYKYSISSLIDLFFAKDFDYICHFCSDVQMRHGGDWISDGIKAIQGKCVSATPTRVFHEPDKHVFNNMTDVFSDQAYLIPVAPFRTSSFWEKSKPFVEGIHPPYGGFSFERAMTSYMINRGLHQAIINKDSIIHPVVGNLTNGT